MIHWPSFARLRALYMSNCGRERADRTIDDGRNGNAYNRQASFARIRWFLPSFLPILLGLCASPIQKSFSGVVVTANCFHHRHLLDVFSSARSPQFTLETDRPAWPRLRGWKRCENYRFLRVRMTNGTSGFSEIIWKRVGKFTHITAPFVPQNKHASKGHQELSSAAVPRSNL